MGKNLIIKGADFSQNAVYLPVIVELTSMSDGYASYNDIVEGVTNFEDVTFTDIPGYIRFTTDLDLTNYKYTSKPIQQTRGNGLLNVWILDANNVIIKKMKTELDGTLDEFEINSELYPEAVSIGFCVGSAIAKPAILPVLVREHI